MSRTSRRGTSPALDGFSVGGAARFIMSGRYADADGYSQRLDVLQNAAERAGP